MSIFDVGGMPDGGGRAECSSAGCRDVAAWTIAWRNPRIHAETRVKEWAACDAHRDHLLGWLASRDFPVVAVPFGETVARVG